MKESIEKLLEKSELMRRELQVRNPVKVAPQSGQNGPAVAIGFRG
jgi:hypothetical protein